VTSATRGLDNLIEHMGTKPPEAVQVRRGPDAVDIVG
jgi:hypothetical protein